MVSTWNFLYRKLSITMDFVLSPCIVIDTNMGVGFADASGSGMCVDSETGYGGGDRVAKNYYFED